MLYWIMGGVVLAGLVVGLVMLAMVFHIRSEMHGAASGRIFTLNNLEDIPERKVAVVLGALVHPDGRLSSVLQERVDTAVELYRNGKVEKLLMSGDNRTRRYNEVNAMRDYAVQQGVPTNDVVRDFAGFRTYDSMYRAKELWDLDEFIIVSQRFHLPRALYIARELDVDAVGVATSARRYRVTPRLIWRERFAWMLAWFDVKAGRDPYFLGDKESLDGDAQQERTQ